MNTTDPAWEWEQYRNRYLTERPETFDAYVDVWLHGARARAEFTGWAIFSQCANAEPDKRRRMAERVEVAESIMTEAGYHVGPLTPRGARRWRRTAPQAQQGFTKRTKGSGS